MTVPEVPVAAYLLVAALVTIVTLVGALLLGPLGVVLFLAGFLTGILTSS